MDHVKKESKRHNLALENHQRVVNKWVKDRINALVLSIKICVEGVKQEHTSAVSNKQCLSAINYLRKE